MGLALDRVNIREESAIEDLLVFVSLPMYASINVSLQCMSTCNVHFVVDVGLALDKMGMGEDGAIKELLVTVSTSICS